MDARDGIVTVTAGATVLSANVWSEGDAVIFADWYADDPSRLMDLVNARVTGRDEAVKWVRDALWYQIMGLGNSSRDTLTGVINLIGNRGWLSTAPHLNSIVRQSCPAIAVGAGPSLAHDLDWLRGAQRHCLIIASDSAVRGLLKEGIYPHLTTPVERDHYVDRLLQDVRDITFAGAGFVLPSIPARFQSHIAVPGYDTVSRWVDEEGVGYGSSTGTAGVRLGLQLTTGPVFIVGHDLCWDGGTEAAGKHTHWTGSNAELHFDADEEVMGNDGVMHPTSHWLMVYRDQIAHMAMESERVFNPNILYRRGATIAGVKAAYLPAGLSLLPPIEHDFSGTASDYRKAFPARAAELPEDIERALSLVATSTCMEHLMAPVICREASRPPMECLLRPGYIQASMERRLGMSDEGTLRGLRNACERILTGSLAEVRAAL